METEALAYLAGVIDVQGNVTTRRVGETLPPLGRPRCLVQARQDGHPRMAPA